MNEKQQLAVMVAMANVLCETGALDDEQMLKVLNYAEYMERIELGVIGHAVSDDEMEIHAVEGTLAMMDFFKNKYITNK